MQSAHKLDMLTITRQYERSQSIEFSFVITCNTSLTHLETDVVEGSVSTPQNKR